MSGYRHDQLMRVLRSGPYVDETGDPPNIYGLQVIGMKGSEWLNISADELKAIAELLGD
jgi:hypothetical protein